MPAPHGALAHRVADAIEETRRLIGGVSKIKPAADEDSLPTYEPPEYAKAVGYNTGGVERFDFATASISSLTLEQLILFLNANIKTLVYAATRRGVTFEQLIRELEAAFRAALMRSRG